MSPANAFTLATRRILTLGALVGLALALGWAGVLAAGASGSSSAGSPASGDGTSYAWSGGDGTSSAWTTPSNWFPEGVPGPGDEASISWTEKGCGVQVADVTVKGLSLLHESCSITGGTVTVTESLTWQDGSIWLTDLVLEAGSESVITSDPVDGYLLLNEESTISNAGTVTFEQGRIRFGAEAVIRNTGEFVAHQGTTFHGLGCCVWPARFENLGTLVVPASLALSSGEVSFDALVFDHRGVVEVEQGTLSLRGPNEWAPDVVLTGAGRTLLARSPGGTRGIAELDGDVLLGAGHTFEVTDGGGLAGEGGLVGLATFVWSGGEITGEHTVSADTLMTVVGEDEKWLTDGLLTTNGEVLFDEGDVVFDFVSHWTSNGTLRAQHGVSLVATSCCVDPNSFVNEGLFVVEGADADGEVDVDALAFIHRGVVEVEQGTLNLRGPTSFDHHVVLSGPGRTRMARSPGGTRGIAELDGDVLLGAGHTFEVTDGGGLAGEGGLVGLATFVWSGGEITGEHTVSAGTLMTIVGEDDKWLTDGLLTTNGEVELADGIVGFDFVSGWTNNGTVHAHDGTSLVAAGSSCCFFANAGTFVADAGSGAVTIEHLLLENDGTIDVRSGVLELVTFEPFANAGALVVAADAAFTAGSTLTVLDGGSIAGSGTVTASEVVNEAGSIQPGTSIGTLTLDATFSAEGAAVLEIDVATTDSHDVLEVVGAAELGGALVVSTVGSVVPEVGDSYTVVTSESRTGEFASVTWEDLPAELGVTVEYTETTVTLVVVPAIVLPGEVTGVVTDAVSGAPVPGAAVEVEGPQTETATTNLDGQYAVDELEPGSYTVTVTALGYVSETKPGIVVEAGQTVTVDVELDRVAPTEEKTAENATASEPLAVKVTSPMPGEVTIEVEDATGDAPAGWVFADKQAQITAPASTAGNPIVLELRVHRSQLADDQTAEDVAVMRDGVFVADCTGPAGVATPDPCISDRETTSDEVVITVLTSQASLWNLLSPELVCPPGLPLPFNDVNPTSVHAASIACAVYREVARGTGTGQYSPSQDVRRGQMASFVVQALEAAGFTLPPASDQGFTDISGNVHESAINRLVDAGIVSGTSVTTFSPGAPVRRSQMATFLTGAVRWATGEDLQPAGGPHFNDTAGNAHASNIDLAFELGLTQGVGEGQFAPGSTVRRAPMASFLVNLLEVLWPEPDATSSASVN